MGEVYRARDTRLDRTVAIKVLPDALATDPQLRERFEREARAISSLQHPHICALFDVGRDGDREFLVLEYLEGETLAARLARAGALPVADALRVAVDVCDALATAHRAGIVHRDLKPANVMLTRAGAKLLDFGLAKAAAPVVTPGGLSMLPTTPPHVTAQGTILGTFQYMAPEQIEGTDADVRTDLFAFGALLFEMVTGRTPFEGKTRASLLGAILKDEPPRVSHLQPLAPPPIDRLVATCLAKDPDDRYQHARDLLRDLQWIASGDESERTSIEPRSAAAPSRLPWGVAAAATTALVIVSAIAVRHMREAPRQDEPYQFSLAPPEGAAFAFTSLGGGTGGVPQFAVSPNGRFLAFVARSQTLSALWIRPLDSLSARMLPGTEQAAYPFWSPDSTYIGFFAGGKLKKAALAGGSPVTLVDAVNGRGGTWSRDDVIVFARANSAGLFRVSASGGAPTQITSVDQSRGDTRHVWPQFLPDGRRVLYVAVKTTAGRETDKPSEIRVAALDGSENQTLVQAESSATFAAGHLIYSRDGSLVAQPLDPVALRVSGDAHPIAEDVANEGSRYTAFSVSSSGMLVFAPGSARAKHQFVWLDRAGRTVSTVGDVNTAATFSLAPDGRRVAETIIGAGNTDVWVLDLARAITMRLTFDPLFDGYPIWSPDSSRVAFTTGAAGGAIATKLAGGGGAPEMLLTAPVGTAWPSDWSADGRFIAYTVNGPKATFDIWILPLDGDHKPYPFVETPFVEDCASFSPDGRWLAYQSDESGVVQVYVQPFPSTGVKYQVSRDGGKQPKWRRDGRELFFLSIDNALLAADIAASREFEAGTPHMLFETGTAEMPIRQGYAVSTDGQRFLFNLPQQRSAQATLTMVLNWPATIQK
jgi:serine/threonine protein kinase/Tol biopolymer transport system component